MQYPGHPACLCVQLVRKHFLSVIWHVHTEFRSKIDEPKSIGILVWPSLNCCTLTPIISLSDRQNPLYWVSFDFFVFVFGISLVNRLSQYCLCLRSALPWSQLWLGSIFIQFGVKLTEKLQILCWKRKKIDDFFALCMHVASSSDCNNGPNIVIIYYKTLLSTYVVAAWSEEWFCKDLVGEDIINVLCQIFILVKSLKTIHAKINITNRALHDKSTGIFWLFVACFPRLGWLKSPHVKLALCWVLFLHRFWEMIQSCILSTSKWASYWA